MSSALATVGALARMARDVRSGGVGRAIGPRRTRRTQRKAKESRSSVPIQQTLLGVILTPDLIRGKPSGELRHDQEGTRAGAAALDRPAQQSGVAARRPPREPRDTLGLRCPAPVPVGLIKNSSLFLASFASFADPDALVRVQRATESPRSLRAQRDLPFAPARSS